MTRFQVLYDKCNHPYLYLFAGEELWYMQYHMPLVNISLPRKLPDLDGDRISELVAACAVTFPSEMTDNRVHIRTNFILISGKKGKIMGRPYLVDTCTDIGAINVTSNLALQFDCTSQHGGESFNWMFKLISLVSYTLKFSN